MARGSEALRRVESLGLCGTDGVVSGVSAMIGIELDSPAGNAVAIVFWAGVWWILSAMSLQWLTPREMPNVPDEKRWHVRAPLTPAPLLDRCADTVSCCFESVGTYRHFHGALSADRAARVLLRVLRPGPEHVG